MQTSIQQFQSARLSGNNLLLLQEEGDNESVLAAKAALAAAAWSPRQLQNGNGTENGIGKENGSGNGNEYRKRNENGNHRESGTTSGSGDGSARGKYIFSTSGRKQVDIEENREKYGNPLEAEAETGTVEVEVDAELDGLLRRTKDLTLAAEAATVRDVESRNALKKRMVDADQRASEAVKAERARSDGLYALVQVCTMNGIG